MKAFVNQTYNLYFLVAIINVIIACVMSIIDYDDITIVKVILFAIFWLLCAIYLELKRRKL